MKKDKITIKINLEEVLDESNKLNNSMREIYEVWARSEPVTPANPTEIYQQHLIEQMRDIAADCLGREMDLH